MGYTDRNLRAQLVQNGCRDARRPRSLCGVAERDCGDYQELLRTDFKRVIGSRARHPGEDQLGGEVDLMRNPARLSERGLAMERLVVCAAIMFCLTGCGGHAQQPADRSPYLVVEAGEELSLQLGPLSDRVKR